MGVDNPVGLKQGVIRTLLMTHDIRGLRSIGKGGAGQGSSLRSLPCHKLRECLVVFNKPCTVLTPANINPLLWYYRLFEVVNNTGKEPPEIALQIGKHT